MATHKGILSKGTKFEFAKYTGGTLGSYTEVENLQKLPSLGGDVEKVEVTTLADVSHQYISGLIEYGDLEFTFLFDNEETTSNYRVIKALGDEVVHVKVTLGDVPLSGTHGSEFTFDAQLSASLDETEPNQALTFTCKAALQSDISVGNPA